MSKYQVMPPLSADEYAELKADIDARGVLVPVEYDEFGEVLDGHHRVQICEELGITEWPRVVRIGLSEAGKLTHARQLNLARRHLDREQKRGLIAQQLRETPQTSDRQIAESLGVSNSTVSVLRKEMVEAGELCESHSSIGADGKERPREVERPSAYRYVDSTPAGQEAVLQSAKDVRQQRVEASREQRATEKAAAVALPIPSGQYRTIVIDPPWEMEKIVRDNRPNPVNFGFEYPTMSEAELAAFDIGAMAHDDCHLFCWTTQKHLPSALRLVETWGFKYVLCMVWHKPGGFQPYNLPQYNCEFVIYARRGSPEFVDTKAFFTCFEAPRREHSRKPDEFYEVIERVTAGPRIDVFSREPRGGFDQFGNETQKFVA